MTPILGSEDTATVRKVVQRFTINTEDIAPASVFAFRHELGTDDVVVGVFDRLGRPLKACEVTVQDGDTIVVKNSFEWSNGDKIVVIG